MHGPGTRDQGPGIRREQSAKHGAKYQQSHMPSLEHRTGSWAWIQGLSSSRKSKTHNPPKNIFCQEPRPGKMLCPEEMIQLQAGIGSRGTQLSTKKYFFAWIQDPREWGLSLELKSKHRAHSPLPRHDLESGAEGCVNLPKRIFCQEPRAKGAEGKSVFV